MSDIWGTVPSWISAAGTIGTAVTVALGVKTYGANKKAREDDELRQARTVLIEMTAMGGIMLVIHNHSREPIYDVWLESARIKLSGYGGWRVTPTVRGALRSTMLIKAESEFKIPVEFLKSDETPYNFVTELVSADLGESFTIRFTDQNGRRWRRTDNRKPTRVYT
ncbi:hypothetical protein [Nocardia nova]|uniref:hypothetical protein n=1 Tax=Nocardia nova TaxID=37330 RepID=UPI0018940EAE|nr:hypothetical protein [Nocardia nova]MBF6144239.1 hypothetical protein [Nocardia nova]